jgi:Fe-S-cluster-containing dehydrogenase component
MCVHACPFGVLTVDADGRGVLKCDLCIERLADGQEPACVAGCPTKAVTFEVENDSTQTKRRMSAAMVVAAQEESLV